MPASNRGYTSRQWFESNVTCYYATDPSAERAAFKFVFSFATIGCLPLKGNTQMYIYIL